MLVRLTGIKGRLFARALMPEHTLIAEDVKLKHVVRWDFPKNEVF